MARKINVEELIQSLNKLRIDSQGKSYTNEEIIETLKAIGLNKVVCGYLISTFPYEKIGPQKLYSFPKEPIHKSVLHGIYNKLNKSSMKSYNKTKKTLMENTSEEVALELLQAKGYQIRKLVGFDMEKFQKENPTLYKKYLIYETV